MFPSRKGPEFELAVFDDAGRTIQFEKRISRQLRIILTSFFLCVCVNLQVSEVSYRNVYGQIFHLCYKAEQIDHF